MSRHRVPDRVDLVVIGAEAAGMDPHEMLDGADVGVLVALEGRLARTRSVAGAAAVALVTIAAHRPFSRDNRAAAWLSAAHVAALNDLDLDLDVGAAVALVDGAAAGVLDERGVARRIAAALGPPSMARQVARRLAGRAAALVRTPERPRPPVPTCPLCRRTLRPERLWLVDPWVVASRQHLVSGCVREHGVHDHDGNRRTTPAGPAQDPRAPLVCGGADVGGEPAFVALTGGGPVLLRPADEPDRAVTYDVVPLDELSVSDLVGRWDDLARDTEPVARVAVEGPLDADQAVLDWRSVRALTGSPSR